MTPTSKSKSKSAWGLGSAACAAYFVCSTSASRVAWALCPNCLAQQSTLTPTLKLIGLFLIVPFAVAAAVYLIVRRAVHGRPNPAPRAAGPHPHGFADPSASASAAAWAIPTPVPDRLADANADAGADGDGNDTTDGQHG